MRRTVILAASAALLVSVTACGRSTNAADATAAVECAALKATLAQPQSAWANGIFAIGASGTPPGFATAVTRMEIAVGDSYGPQLSDSTIATIKVVADMCASKEIGVGHITLSPALDRALRGRDSNSQPTG